jgi:hypothetical protein
MVVAQPVATPYFTPELDFSYTTHLESPPVTETFAPDQHTVQPEGVPVGETRSTTPDVTAPARTALVESSGPRYSPSQSRTDIPSTANEWKSWPDEALGRSEMRSKPVSDPQRDAEQATPPVDSRAEEASPSRLTPRSGAEVTELTTPIRVVARTREVSMLQETAGRRPAVPVSDARSSEHSSVSRARPAHVRPADRPQTSPGAYDEVETFPVETPALVRPSPIIQQERSLASTLLEKPGAPPPVHVRIGTVEVRALTPPATPPPGPQPAGGSAPGGFDDYAMIRSYVSWGRR